MTGSDWTRIRVIKKPFFPRKIFPIEWRYLSEDSQWMLCKTKFTEYILQSIAYKAIEFLFIYFARFDFLK